MGDNESSAIGRGQWMALAAALLGWMFDGLEQGLFPLAARPALRDLLSVSDEGAIGRWFAVATAGFLIGAATGGVLFGWLGDRIGRVRAMTLSVMTYAIFSGLCGFANSAVQISLLRFLSALGMGGEWSLGVALVMEVWPNRSRALLAGLIGAAANVGYLLIGLLGYGLSNFLTETHGWLAAVGLPEATVETLTAHQGWRLLMFLGALPAILTFFIRLFVPESERWEKEQKRGTTSHWASRDLLGVIIGALAAGSIVYLWADPLDWAGELRLLIQIGGTLVAVAVVTLGYLYPVVRYIQRSQAAASAEGAPWRPTVRRMLLGACLGGVPLLVTWSAIQWASVWADKLNELSGGFDPAAKAKAQIASAIGAIVGTVTAALIGGWLGRRLTYFLLCVTALAAVLALFQLNTEVNAQFLVMLVLAGGISASFYGWLPLYLPELFRTAIRATGQGFSYNFGRILAAIGVLQTGNLVGVLGGGSGGDAAAYPMACSILSLIYIAGAVLIWFAPETRGQPLPD
jgi:SHS family sialic acid transporter-like MFS transporter